MALKGRCSGIEGCCDHISIDRRLAEAVCSTTRRIQLLSKGDCASSFPSPYMVLFLGVI
jgi:hypothetical protein